MIPKLLHQIWWGPRPSLLDRCMRSWETMADKHGWTYKCWTEEEILDMPLKNREAYDGYGGFHHTTDLARIEIIEKYGGVYVDCDFEWSGIDPTTIIPLNQELAVVSLEHSVPHHWLPKQPRPLAPSTGICFSVSFLAAPPRNQFVRKLVRDAKQVYRDNIAAFRSRRTEGRCMTGCSLWVMSWDCPVVVLPARYICPASDTTKYLAKCHSEWRKQLTKEDYERFPQYKQWQPKEN